MKKLLPVIVIFLFTSNINSQHKSEYIDMLRQRNDVSVTEIQANIFRLEFSNGKILYKNLNDYIEPEQNKVIYSPTFDSTIIDLSLVDTNLYADKYHLWREVPVGSGPVSTVLTGDVNNNRRSELYGSMKDYDGSLTDIVVFELNAGNYFDSVFSYDSTIGYLNTSGYLIDLDNDNWAELGLAREGAFGYYGKSFPFYKKTSDSSLAVEPYFIFHFLSATGNGSTQQNNNRFGYWDGDSFIDQTFIKLNQKIYFFEFNPLLPNFDSTTTIDFSELDLDYAGFSIGDFDMDGKTEFLAGSVHGKVLSMENNGNNSYAVNWQGAVATYNAYLCTETNDIDRNGKKEIWIAGDAFYSGVGKTRVTILESDGNNSYYAVGKIDIVGVFSFLAGNIQALDIDGDGKEEILLGLEGMAIVLKFSGSQNHQKYELFYIKKDDPEPNSIAFYGANFADLDSDYNFELLINLRSFNKWLNWIYKPDFEIGVKEIAESPEKYFVSSNYPNPFNSSSKIKVEVGKATFTSIKVYDMLGKEIEVLLEAELSAGKYEFTWNAGKKEIPSGMYVIRVNSGNYTRAVKAVLIK